MLILFFSNGDKKMKFILIIIMAIFSQTANAHVLWQHLPQEEQVLYFGDTPVQFRTGERLHQGTIQLNEDEILDIYNIYVMSVQKIKKMEGYSEADGPTHDGLDHSHGHVAWVGALVSCDTKAMQNPEEYSYGSVPMFIGPPSFVMPEDTDGNFGHNHEYSLTEGIEFYCSDLIPIIND